MPEFTAEVDVDPSEFVDSCSKRELQRLVQILEEDGHIEPSQSSKSNTNGVRKPNGNDLKFWASLDHLGKCRDLLTIEEEEYINKLADKFKHLR